MIEPTPSPPPRTFTPWWCRAEFAVAGSAVLAAGGTTYLAYSGRSMGAVAFGGCNLLALLLFAAAWRPMTVVLRSQTVGSAVTSWLLAMAWTIGVVGLYRLDYVQAATLLLCAVTLLYVLCAWLIVSGRVPPEPPSENSPPDE